MILSEHGDESFVSGFNQQLLNLRYGSKLGRLDGSGPRCRELPWDNGDIFAVAPTLAPWNG